MLPEAGFLKNADPETRTVLAGLARERKLAKGETLFEQGDDGDTLWVVQAGALEISVLAEDGRRLALDRLDAGAIFGEIALFDPGVRTATATAVGETVVLGIRNGDLREAIAASPELAVDLIRLAGERMRWMNRQIGEQAFLPLPARLARKLLHLIKDGADSLPMSQASLAEYVGVSREAVSKTLSEWKKTGIVDVGRGTIHVKDREGLGEIAHEDLV